MPEQTGATISRSSLPGAGWRAYVLSSLVVAFCAALGQGVQLLLPSFEDINVVLLLLLGVVFVATRLGLGPAIFASVLSVLSFDIIFVSAVFSPIVAEVESLITLVVMLVVAIIISGLAGRAREQAGIARAGEKRALTLYSMSRELSRVRGVPGLVDVCLKHVSNVFDSGVEVLLADEQKKLAQVSACQLPSEGSEPCRAVAQELFESGLIKGSFSPAQPPGNILLVPLIASRGLIGMMIVFPRASEHGLSLEQIRLLETLSSQTALALERAHLVGEAQQASIAIESERLRNTLLSSISHDLRTPLAAITGSATSLLESEGRLDAQARRDLALAIVEESNLLNRLVGELLDMTRLESGTVELNKEWQPIEEPVGAALKRLDFALRGRPLKINLSADLPMVRIDGALISQVLFNLLDNAIKYTQADSVLDISAIAQENGILVEVSDRGDGLPPGQEERIFDKFYRGRRSGGGVGLGLSICRSIVEAHGGRIWAENREGGGAVFRFNLPQDETPPTIGDSGVNCLEEPF